MKPINRQKMCANCNARASLEATECPYCAAEFLDKVEARPTQSFSYQPHSLEESLASLYQPPYATQPATVPPPAPLKSEWVEQEPPSIKKEVVYKAPPPILPTGEGESLNRDTIKSDFWALFALIVGGNLLTLGLMQFFFAEKGVLRLEWDSSYWYFYCLIALPLFYLGFKKANSVPE